MSYIVIGCGISGAVLARKLADAGKRVKIYERRNHIAGNMYDYVDKHGFLVQQYGPHIFHTSIQEVYDYISRFGNWKPFKLVCGAEWDGKYTPSPFNFTTIDIFYEKDKAEKLKQIITEYFPERKYATVVELLEHENREIREFAKFLFKNDYAPYTAKQWGIDATEVDPGVLKRVPVRLSYDTGYFNDTYEMMPEKSFTAIIENMLNHPCIEVRLGVEAKEHISFSEKKVLWDNSDEHIIIFTGAVDELFDARFGNLPYRSLRFEWKYSTKDSIQEAPVVAYPKAEGYTRITEFKKLPPQSGKGSTYALEYPLKYVENKKMEPYYPVSTRASEKQYNQYKELADRYENLHLCGRLADFKYYNMDQAIKNALDKGERLLRGSCFNT